MLSGPEPQPLFSQTDSSIPLPADKEKETKWRADEGRRKEKKQRLLLVVHTAVCAIFNSPEQWLPCISGRPTVAVGSGYRCYARKCNTGKSPRQAINLCAVSSLRKTRVRINEAKFENMHDVHRKKRVLEGTETCRIRGFALQPCLPHAASAI